MLCFYLTLLDQIPYVEAGDCYVAYNNEKGGVVASLKEDGIVDLDSDVQDDPEWISMKAMITSWLADAVTFELWVASDGSSAHKIYYSDLPWPIGKLLYHKQVIVAKQQLGITNYNADRREDEVLLYTVSVVRANVEEMVTYYVPFYSLVCTFMDI